MVVILKESMFNRSVMMGNEKSTRASFKWLNVTQFFGALNDNLFRWLIIFFLLHLKPDVQMSMIVGVVSLIFVLPFLLFSHSAGVLADRLSKRSVIVFSKWFELVIMALGCLAILTEATWMLYCLMFLMCTQSTIFGPSKYGIIPEIVPEEDLSKANGYMTGLTYLAIILGTFVTTLIVEVILPGNYFSVSVLCLTISIIGVFTSCQIVKTPAVDSGKKFSALFFVKIFQTLFSLKKNRHLLLAVLGSVYFLGLGGFIQQTLVIYAKVTLGFAPEKSGYLFPVAAIGIGLGALMAGKASGRNIEFGLVPVGAFILTICNISLYFINPGLPPADITFLGFLDHVSTLLVVLFFIGIGSGLFIVPLTAFIQYSSPKGRLGEILACNNFFSFLAVGFSAVLLMLLDKVMHLSPNECFLIGGIMTGVMAIIATIILPDFLVRFVVMVITKIFYRIKVKGLENLPVDGPALLVSNHVTWVDALLISATQERRIRFMMARHIYNGLWLKPIFKLMGVIPISPDDPPRKVIESFKKAQQSMADGYMVCIFAEGALTRNGNLRAFKPGFERIVKGTDYPVIPICIEGAWGSLFSYFYGKMLSRIPKRFPYKTSVSFGEKLPATTSAAEVREALLELSADAIELKKGKNRTLTKQFITEARRHWCAHALGDTTGKSLSFGRTLTGSIALSAELKKIVGDAEMIGVLLPSSVGGALVNIAVTLLGKVPVNLNFTASDQAMQSAIKQCEIKTIITSQAFLEKMENLKSLDGLVCLEDIMPAITTGKKLVAMIKARVAPQSMINSSATDSDSTATVIFSSGSTGEPKGVVLSHHNIISNIESFSQAFRFMPNDRMCGILPFFHSFGYTVTLWAPLVARFSVHYHPNPVDGSKIAEIVREKKLTILMATPTFLLAYIRRAKKEDFASLRVVVTGAEKLKKKLADTFEERFDIRPFEGYGATELSPVASLNVADVDIGESKQVGNKEGSIGHPCPGIAMKIVDMDTGESLAFNQEGLLMVKGPNVMREYLGDPEKTAEVLQDGWYNTGDIGKMDEDGFVFLMDRLSRFSKIGGEMVPHLAVEDILFQALGAIDPILFVTGVPDERKGEQLVVLYTEEAGKPEDLQKIVDDSDLPNLWRPKKTNYYQIDGVPKLGSGKLDLKSLKQKALEFAENKSGADPGSS